MEGVVMVDFNDFKVIWSIKCVCFCVLYWVLSLLYGNRLVNINNLFGNFEGGEIW